MQPLIQVQQSQSVSSLKTSARFIFARLPQGTSERRAFSRSNLCGGGEELLQAGSRAGAVP